MLSDKGLEQAGGYLAANIGGNARSITDALFAHIADLERELVEVRSQHASLKIEAMEARAKLDIAAGYCIDWDAKHEDLKSEVMEAIEPFARECLDPSGRPYTTVATHFNRDEIAPLAALHARLSRASAAQSDAASD